jgi:spermidine synthase
VSVEKLLFIQTNSYANYQILSGGDSLTADTKTFIINEAYSSRVNNEGKGFAYMEAIKKILFDDLHLRDADILVLGAGGFSLTANNSFDNRITYVDIDKQIKDVALPRFIKKLDNPFVADDARHFLKATNKQYAAIVIDVYTDLKAIPAHLVTAESMQAIHQHLSANGVAIFNVVSNPMLTDLYSKRIDNTIRAVFHHCMVQPLVYANRVTNLIYLCNINGIEDKKIYTDNLNRSTTDSFNW